MPAPDSFRSTLVNLGGMVILLCLVGALACAVYQVLLFFGRTRQRRREDAAERGICPNCGYNCRASDRLCSECGERNPVYYRQEIREMLRRDAAADEAPAAEPAESNGKRDAT
jgi:hypothetical protein